MTTIYSGNPNNVSDALSRTITGCADNGSGAIRVTTSAAHLFSSHDIVIVTGVTGTTEANGTWPITVIDATHFDLVGPGFVHAYVSGGSAVDHSLTPAATLPSDGEPLTSSSILSSIQLLLDRTQKLATRELANIQFITVAPSVFNISYGADWAIGDDGTTTATGSRLVKTVTNDNAIIVELTPYLTRFDGRTLRTIRAVFAVGQSHSGIPAILPEMRLFRTQSLTSTGVAPAADQSLLAAGGAPYPTPGSAGLYYDSGFIQTWDLDTDQNKVIDITRRYYVAIIDESGANALPHNQYFGFNLFVV
jgi:hypothetical protein